MKKHMLILPVILVAVVAFILTLGTSAFADPPTTELDETEVFIEYNSTDGDFGIQFFWDGEAWDEMNVVFDEEVVLSVVASESAAEQGLTEGFFESAEPTLDEFLFSQFLARFPEGEYEFVGQTINPTVLVGEAEFTHIIPCPPEVEVIWNSVTRTLSVSWEEVEDIVDPTQEIEPAPALPTCIDPEGELEIWGYEVVFEVEIKVGGDTRVFVNTQTLTADARMATASPEFVDLVEDAGKKVEELKFEVIAQEESGNKTITEREIEMEFD